MCACVYVLVSCEFRSKLSEYCNRFIRHTLYVFHHPNSAGQMSRSSVSVVFLVGGGEKAPSAAYLCHADVWPLVVHHFTSLLTGGTVTGAACDSTVDYLHLSPRHLGKATSTCLMFWNKRRAVDGDSETMFFH